MNVFYPKLVAGTALFIAIGLFAGATIGIFFFVAMLPMLALFSDPDSASQIALMVAALLGFGIAVVVITFGTGAWKKRVETDLYRERGPRYVAPPPRRPRAAPIAQRTGPQPQPYTPYNAAPRRPPQR